MRGNLRSKESWKQRWKSERSKEGRNDGWKREIKEKGAMNAEKAKSMRQ